MFLQRFPTRREVLAQLGGGFGALALGSLLRGAEESRKGPHFAPKTKAVIQLFMHGGPSHVDLFDPKPLLEKHDGQDPPREVADDEKITDKLLKSPYKFKKSGESGVEFSETLPHIADHADEIAVIRSMFTEHRNHEQALWMMHTGLTVAGRPSIGAWASYALGSESRDLPAYVVLRNDGTLPVDGIRNWSSGWLPPRHQRSEEPRLNSSH